MLNLRRTYILLLEIVHDREAWYVASMGLQRVGRDLGTDQHRPKF